MPVLASRDPRMKEVYTRFSLSGPLGEGGIMSVLASRDP